jgi:hypothetical protein
MGEHSQPIEGSLEGPMNYAKAIAAVLAAAASAVVAALTGDATVSTVEWINVAIATAGALSVFTAANVPGAEYTKSILAALTAALMLAVNLVDGGLDVSEWLQLGLAALGALGVYVVPNASRELIVE